MTEMIEAIVDSEGRVTVRLNGLPFGDCGVRMEQMLKELEKEGIKILDKQVVLLQENSGDTATIASGITVNQ